MSDDHQQPQSAPEAPGLSAEREHGQTLVPIPDLLWEHNAVEGFDPSHPEFGIDDEGRRCLAIDTCIVPVVKRLWDQGVVTLSCCCGHGSPWGVITIQTQPHVGQRGAMVMRAERYNELIETAHERDEARAALAESRASNERLRAALDFYEEPTNYACAFDDCHAGGRECTTAVGCDAGQIAREALAQHAPATEPAPDEFIAGAGGLAAQALRESYDAGNPIEIPRPWCHPQKVR